MSAVISSAAPIAKAVAVAARAALAGETEQAFEHLERGLELGLLNPRSLIDDRDLTRLRQDAR